MRALSHPPQGKEHVSTAVGEVTVIWLCMSWISTVILGIPILTAVYGSARDGQFYGLLAGAHEHILHPAELSDI